MARAFRISKWVVRARLTAVDDNWGGSDESWALIHARVLHAYKGRPPARLLILTRGRDAGRWLDKRSLGDLGQDYLLFLRPGTPGAPVKGATVISNACGGSKPWSRVSEKDVRALHAPFGRVVLARRRYWTPQAAPRPVETATSAAPEPPPVQKQEPQPEATRRGRHWRWPAPLRALFHPHRPAAGDDNAQSSGGTG